MLSTSIDLDILVVQLSEQIRRAIADNIKQGAQQTAQLSASTKRMGLPKTEIIDGQRHRVIEKISDTCNIVEPTAMRQLVRDENGDLVFDDKSKRRRGEIEALQGGFKMLYKANRRKHTSDVDSDEEVSSIKWTATQMKLVDGAWVKISSKPITVTTLVSELRRLTAGYEDQVMALVEQATEGV